jgi:hypothetical protein
MVVFVEFLSNVDASLLSQCTLGQKPCCCRYWKSFWYALRILGAVQLQSAVVSMALVS